MWPFKKEKKMGGENESVLQADKATAASPSQGGSPPGSILQPDIVQQPVVEQIRPVYGPQPPLQTQTIRQHMNAGQVHLHCDAQNIKVAIPVAEWYVIMRQLRSLAPFTWLDPDNQSVAYFKPYINGVLFEIAIELAPINIGNRFKEMNQVTGKR